MSDFFSDDDFDHLRTNQTSWLPMHDVLRSSPKLELELRFIGEGNEDAERLRNNNAFRELSKKDNDQAADQLLAKTVIVGWRNAVGKDGKEQQYAPALGVALLEHLRRVKRRDLLNRIIIHASTPEHFTAPVVDAGELGKP